MKSSNPHSFCKRHIGVSDLQQIEMLEEIGVESIEQLISETIPPSILRSDAMCIPNAITEHEYLDFIEEIADRNKVFRTYIGQGYYGTIVPSVIVRNIFENPGWYTQYTPYQAEISQGRLEALLNFQTVVSDLTALPMANASLLDEATAAAEAMAMFFRKFNKGKKKNPSCKYFVDHYVYPQTIDVLITRAKPLGIDLVIGDFQNFESNSEYFGALLQYPNAEGSLEDYNGFISKLKLTKSYLCVAADLLTLTLLTPPGEWGADVVIGNSQRLGVPLGYGGPHAAYFAASEEFKRLLPGRIIGVSVDRLGNRALRMALQTREQHIKRQKATSNICTAQALLAIMAGMYAVYHGPRGLQQIAEKIQNLTKTLAIALHNKGWTLMHSSFFDTICLQCSNEEIIEIKDKSIENKINFWYTDGKVIISLDETCGEEDIIDIVNIFDEKGVGEERSYRLDEMFIRKSSFLEQEVFSAHHTETKMMRYIKSLENKDLSLVHSMIALGSCTMKLNAATELIPITNSKFANIHPFVPQDQALGYQYIFKELENYLNSITGFTACSLQPNSGAQGEFTGLLLIRAYLDAQGEFDRNVVIIPSSAHGTNPASAIMAGMEVVITKCNDLGDIDLVDFELNVNKYKDRLAAFMVTYPSTHGVFEEEIKIMCEMTHAFGGLVYMDGANMNAQVGYTTPRDIGADVCHLNLHKTFGIPHGGGGPGMGPVCVNDKLKPYLPNHVYAHCGGKEGIHAVSAAPWSSANIVLVSYAYIRLLGLDGLKKATQYAILNANYMMKRLAQKFPALYKGDNGYCAHEFIIDLRQFKALDITAEDIAKRLMDYSFHAPTVSFPVPGTFMIEPTESESKDEMDRFCNALLNIHKEIEEIANGEQDVKNNVLKNAPHTMHELTDDEWNYAYSRQKAAFPLQYLKNRTKFWASVARVDNAHGDRQLVCTCPPIEDYIKDD